MADCKSPGWRTVTMRELNNLWNRCRNCGVLYNGMTSDILRRRYGRDNIRHVMGDGWYKRDGARPLPLARVVVKTGPAWN